MGVGGHQIKGDCKISVRMSKEIKEAIRKVARSGVYIYI